MRLNSACHCSSDASPAQGRFRRQLTSSPPHPPPPQGGGLVRGGAYIQKSAKFICRLLQSCSWCSFHSGVTLVFPLRLPAAGRVHPSPTAQKVAYVRGCTCCLTSEPNDGGYLARQLSVRKEPGESRADGGDISA